MTEETAQTNTQKPNEKAVSFWSSWQIFFLGISPAALNWWRMGNKRKANIFLFVVIVLLLLQEWLTVQHSPAEFELAQIVLAVTVIFWVVFHIFLAILVKRDVKEFEKSGKTPVPTSWMMMFRFLATVFVPVLVINYCLYSLPVGLGGCPFPRLQNVVYQVQLTQRTGLDKLFLSRNDFGCNWAWLDESQKTENISGIETHRYRLYGDFSGQQGDVNGVIINQDIYVFKHPVREQDLGPIMAMDSWMVGNSATSALDLIIGKYGMYVFYDYCKDFFEPRGKRCVVYLLHQTLLVRLDFKFSPSLQVESYMLQATQKTAERLLEYSETP